eukprot:633774-Amphidinium_carterae.1
MFRGAANFNREVCSWNTSQADTHMMFDDGLACVCKVDVHFSPECGRYLNDINEDACSSMATAVAFSRDHPSCSKECADFHELRTQTKRLWHINLVDVIACYIAFCIFVPCIGCFHEMARHAEASKNLSEAEQEPSAVDTRAYPMSKAVVQRFRCWFFFVFCLQLADIALCAWALTISLGSLPNALEEMIDMRCVSEAGNFALHDIAGSLEMLRDIGVFELIAGVLAALLDIHLLRQMRWMYDAKDHTLPTVKLASLCWQAGAEIALELLEAVAASLDFFKYSKEAFNGVDMIQAALLGNTTLGDVSCCMVPTKIPACATRCNFTDSTVDRDCCSRLLCTASVCNLLHCL